MRLHALPFRTDRYPVPASGRILFIDVCRWHGEEGVIIPLGGGDYRWCFLEAGQEYEVSK